MKFSTRNDREKSFVNPERAASKIWRRLACAMLCVVLLGSNLTVAFATEGTTLTENEPVVTEQTAEVPETTEPKASETTEPKAPETSEPETPETTEPKAPETSEPETPETTEPKAPETSEPETPETTEPKVPETTVPETTVPETTVPETTVPETTVPETTVPEEEAVTYTLYLTHVFRFKVDGKRGSVQASEEITLTEADFVDGVCDISRFAQKAEQIQVTKANPVSIKEFDANHKGGTQILYAVKSGWKVVRKENATGEGSVLREVFSGKLSDYEFVPVKVLTLNLKFAYSNTGGLAGIDAASPVTVQLEPTEIEGKYKVEYPLPPVEGFRIVLDPTELNRYVVNPPKGNETEAELKAKLENGDFDVDIANKTIYYNQQPDNNGTETHPQYGNQYSTEYNEAWNTARTLTAKEYTATAVGDNNNKGANPLENPRLEVTLTEEQLNKALENQLSITVYYRRNATWYTVNHWVPQTLAGGNTAGLETKEVEGTTYVRLDQERLQGRVGATTRARAKVEGVYEQLTPVGFTQKEIANTGTVVDIDYKAADSYRVIFDTDYTYIPRQQVALGSNVNFTNLTEPKRTGYTFDGWRYLNKNARPNADGSYNDDQYTELNKDNPELTVNNELIGKAKLTESGGVLALHLYPKWNQDKTQVRVILWTEDLTGTDDVQAFAEDGNTTYYDTKYDAYKAAPLTHKPQPGTSNSNYSNAGSFTVDVDTDSSLVEADNAKKLLEKIQTRVKDEFKVAMGQVSGIDVANFYTQAAFEIVHEEESGINYKATTASADGKTTIYVYFTRNVYELRFTYYGTADNFNYSVAKNTNGYSWGGINDAASVFPGGDLNFGYRGTGNDDTRNNKWVYNLATSDVDMPVPKTITIKAKYGADLRNVWPVARGDEQISSVRMISWATTQGKYCKDGQFGTAAGSTHDGEPTIMGVYAAMGAEIVADPENTSAVHHLVAYWWTNTPSYYRYNHCYEVPGLNVNDTGVQRVSIPNNDPENVKNFLYLVPTDNAAIAQYGFNDLMRVSYKDGQITYNDPDGTYYAVRAYTTGDTIKYYAVARQVIAVSTNTIEKQNPSARLHMIRVNDKADHSTQYGNSAGGSAGNAIGTAAAPYDLYFYYNRDRYTITYMAPSNNITTATEVTLGTVTLPYGALVTQKKYGYELDYKSKNTDLAYGWTPAPDEVSVCPDRAKDGTAAWTFEGWALGPGGVNMQWPMNEDTETEVQAGESFAIESNLRLYAIWGSPTYRVTFHFNGGKDAQDREVVVENVPANRRYSSTENVIPRPLKGGYTLEGWYMADEDGKITNSETPFTFDETITSNMHVAAKWLTVSTKTFDYTVYYVTDTPHEADKTKPPVQINDFDEIVGTGGTTYYVLDKVEQKNQMFIANSSLKFSAKTQNGYVPRQADKILTMVGDPENDTYNVIFYYAPITPGQHTVRFVEAGTEDTTPAVVKTETVNADQTVVTPQSAHATGLKNMGYCLVVKNAGGGYTVVKNAMDMKWYDKDGTEKEMVTLTGNDIPETITYLVQPIAYTVTYKNADGSPSAAGAALTAVTANAGTPVASAGNKNPTQYTTKDTFTATNPERVYENGKWYNFTRWSLGANTKVGNNSDFTDATLKVDRGTVGNLEFVANWAEVTDVGSLTVSKTVAGNAGDQAKDFNFRVTLNDTTISGTFGGMNFTNGVATFQLRHNGTITATNLPTGVGYTVAETAAEDYTTTVAGNNENGTITAGETTVAFTNTRKTGDLTVSKKVAGTGAETDRPFSFTVTLSDTTINGAFGGMTFTDGKATFALKDGESKTAEKLPVGITYTVTEEETKDYTVSATGEKGTITADQPMTAAFTNTKKEAPAPETGSLTVSKKVTGTGAETDRPFSFTVILGDTTISDTYGEMTFTDGKATFTLKDGESKTAEKLPVGITYTVTETETEDYTVSATGEKGTITADQPMTAAFTNTKKETPAQETGSLTVSKKVTGTGAETDRPFSFTVILGDTTISDTYGEMTFTDGKATFTLKDGESKTAEKLPVGVTYTVTEEETKDYTASSTGARGTVAKDQTLTAAFTNTKKETPAQETGSLTVSKKVTGTGAETDRPFSFTVTLSDTTISGVYGDMTFTDGEATFALKDGESKTAEKLPVGVTYTVTEEETKDYTASSTGAKGTIAKDQTLTAAFTNTKKEAPAPETGDLTVTKKVTGYKADKTKAFTFVVTLDDETINGQYGDMKFVDGRAEFTLKHGESKTAEDLPAGVAYTVKEGDNAGYAVTKTGDTGTIQARRNVYARFTNRKTNLDNYYQTGDETKLELWAGMAALCFLGAVVSLVISKKRKGKFSK